MVLMASFGSGTFHQNQFVFALVESNILQIKKL